MMLSDYYYSLGITLEELDTLQEAFQLYDTTNVGYISTEQFAHILSSLNIVTDTKQVSKIVKLVDMNGDGRIDFHEFVLAMFRYLPHEAPTTQQQPVISNTISCFNNNGVIFSDKEDEEIMACFEYFDKDHDGRISEKELEEVMVKLDSRLTRKELKDMMAMADINRDGFIDFDEFKQLLPPL